MLKFISSDNGIIEIKGDNIVLKKKSPSFSNESIEGEITFPFTIPMTDELRRWLNFPDRIEAVNQSPIKRIQLIRNGHPILTGDLKLGDADSKQVETTLFTGSSPFAALIKDICLDELDLGFQTFATEAEMLAYWNASVNGNVFTHPYYLPSIYSEKTGHLNYWWQDRGGYVLNFNGDPTYMSPMLYYAWLLPKLFESFGYEFDDKVFIDSIELREQLFFSMHNINSQADKLTIHYADLLPHYKISTWLIDIQNAYCCKFYFDNSKQKVTLDWQVSAINNASKAKTVSHKQPKVKTVDQVPTRFNYVLNDAQAIWPIPERMLPAVWLKKDLPNPADFPNKFCYVADEDKTYVFYNNGVEYIAEVVPNLEDYFGMFGWPARNYLANFSIGKAGIISELVSNIHPLHVLYPTGIMRNFGYLEEDAKTIPPYVLFAKHTTDIGSNWVKSDYFLNNFSFTWPKSTWLLQNKILPWWEFLKNAKAVEDTILLSDVDLANWDWTIPLLIGNTPVLIDEMEIPLSAESELMEVKVTGFRM